MTSLFHRECNYDTGGREGGGGREDEERIEESTAAKQFTQILGFCYIHVQLLLQHLYVELQSQRVTDVLCTVYLLYVPGVAIFCLIHTTANDT